MLSLGKLQTFFYLKVKSYAMKDFIAANISLLAEGAVKNAPTYPQTCLPVYLPQAWQAGTKLKRMN